MLYRTIEKLQWPYIQYDQYEICCAKHAHICKAINYVHRPQQISLVSRYINLLVHLLHVL